jgi:hypothetical protein
MVDRRIAATERLVCDPAAVAAVDPVEAMPTGWAAGRRRSSVSLDMHNTVKHQQALDPQTSEVWK